MAALADYPMTTRMAERLEAAISQWQTEEFRKMGVGGDPIPTLPRLDESPRRL